MDNKPQDHSWMNECVQVENEYCERQNLSCGDVDMGQESFSPTTFISRNQDVSFGYESQLGHSPAFTCKSSFLSLLVDASTPCSEACEIQRETSLRKIFIASYSSISLVYDSSETENNKNSTEI